jgi:3-hydroxyisobutyrate dehydrogenase-like beta-hydroxyacid dehydrogenase
VMRMCVLGLGQMGAAIARRLQRADVELTVWNRSHAPTREFGAAGVRIAASPADAASGADVCITMLSDGAAVTDVLLGDAGALEATKPPSVVVEMSTIDVATSAALAWRANERRVAYIRAPVSGNPSVVAAGNLTILTSGDPAAVERVRSALEAIGPTVHYLGDGEQARVMKLALNLMVAGTAQLLAESLALGEANGLGRRQMLDVIASSAVGSPFVSYKTEPLVRDDYTSTFSTRLMAKDLRLVAACAADVHVPTPATDLVRELVDDCVEAGMGELDFMALLPRLTGSIDQARASAHH